MNREKVDFYSNEMLRIYDLDPEVREQLKILDSLDAFTRKHSVSVATLTNKICKQLGLDEGFTIYCTVCAFVHDVGKMFIPPRVLQKEGKLTDEEFEIIKSHTTIGYNICHANLNLRPYEAGALYHHEALDGTGYPNGLVGNDILIEGQIIRVADEYDAISSKRQYKAPISTLDTLKILIENTKPTKRSKMMKVGLFYKKVGKNNPKIVKALIKVIIEEIEHELYENEVHLEHLKNEISRYNTAYSMYKKYLNAKDKDKGYYHSYVKGYLVPGEEMENLETYLLDINNTRAELENKYVNRKNELKEIRKLKV